MSHSTKPVFMVTCKSPTLFFDGAIQIFFFFFFSYSEQALPDMLEKQGSGLFFCEHFLRDVLLPQLKSFKFGNHSLRPNRNCYYIWVSPRPPIFSTPINQRWAMQSSSNQKTGRIFKLPSPIAHVLFLHMFSSRELNNYLIRSSTYSSLTSVERSNDIHGEQVYRRCY